MTISTSVYIEHPDIGLGYTIRTLPEVTIGVIPDAGTDPEHNVYFFWIEARDFDAVEATLTEDRTVADFARVAELGDRNTYRIQYSDRAKLISPAITELDGIMLESRSRLSGWVVRLLLPDHGTLYHLKEHADEKGIQFEVREIHQTVLTEDHFEFTLTESQTEALVSAYEHGYYDEPRETSLEELGAVLGISRTAVSGRLRRASGELIAQSLGYTGRRNE